MRANNGYMGGLHRHTRRTSHPEDIRRGCDTKLCAAVVSDMANAAILVSGTREGAGASPHDVA